MILDDICEYKREEVSRQMAAEPLDVIQERLEGLRKPRNFREALRGPRMSLIAEVKLASPVKGVFLDNVDPLDLAALYEQAGAHALSILTDEHYFQGALATLSQVHKRVGVPCLRKDFIIDEYQVYQARAAEADAILLIVRCLSDDQLRDFLQLARSLKMDCLVETHTAEEVERALKADAHIIGINNRDLGTFEVDLNTTLELKKMVPGGKVLVSESGIRSRADVQKLEDGGVDAILVGEALVTSKDIAGMIQHLLGNGEH